MMFYDEKQQLIGQSKVQQVNQLNPTSKMCQIKEGVTIKGEL